MPFPFALAHNILLSFIVISTLISSILSILSFNENTGGVFQGLALCFDLLSLITVIGCLCHQCTSRDGDASNARNLCLFGICTLLGIARAALLTVHARQDGGRGMCHDFARAAHPCVPAGVQLGMAYITPLLALIGFLLSWLDRFPGAVQLTPRYPITKAPSSRFAAYAHELDGSYTRPPVKVATRSRHNSEWSDVPL